MHRDRHVGEDLAVEGDPGLLEPVHELGVGQAADAGGRVDAGDPKAADFALLIATIAIDVLQRMLDLLFSRTIRTGLGAIVALGTAQNDATLLMSVDCTLYTRH